MEKKAKAEAKLARRNQRKLEPEPVEGAANPSDEAETGDLTEPEPDSNQSEGSK